MASKQMVIVEDLVKVYPGGTQGLSNKNLSVSEGEFVGFLGPNGDGKSPLYSCGQGVASSCIFDAMVVRQGSRLRVRG